MEKENSKINWIIVIIGSIILLSFIILPPVLRMMIKDDTEIIDVNEDNSNNTVIKNDYLVCMKNISTDSYTVNDKIVVYGENGITTIIARNKLYNYFNEFELDNSTFLSKKDSLNSISGIYYNYNIRDYKVEEYNLEEEFRITIGQIKETTMVEDLIIKDNVNDLKSDLINNGYSCQ